MANITWLASYPKSGNTWVRIFLANYLRNATEPVSINKLDVGSIASTRTWFDDWVGIEASALKDNIIERLRPQVYRCMAREEKQTLFIKVHDAWRLTDSGEGLFPKDATGGVIYILRNPLDMVSSCAHHWGVGPEQAVKYLCDPEFEIAQSSDSLSVQLSQRLGAWSHHVCSWLDESCLPVLVVRYEDLQQAPEEFFGKIIEFCNLPFDEERLRRAISFSGFSELQRQEKSNDFSERSIKAPGPFFRRGQAGTWREELPSHLVQRLIEVHGEVMRRFGYLDINNEPV